MNSSPIISLAQAFLGKGVGVYEHRKDGRKYINQQTINAWIHTQTRHNWSVNLNPTIVSEFTELFYLPGIDTPLCKDNHQIILVSKALRLCSILCPLGDQTANSCPFFVLGETTDLKFVQYEFSYTYWDSTICKHV